MLRLQPLLAPVFFGLVLLAAAAPRAEEEEKPNVIQDGRAVSVEYTLKLDDGTTADTNVGDKPLVYQHGQGQILPALERSLVGLKVGDRKGVTLSPEQGYGVPDPKAVRTVPLEAVPEDARQVGTELVAQDPNGARRQVHIREIRETEIVLDFNHPLAGRTLHFDVRVLGIE